MQPSLKARWRAGKDGIGHGLLKEATRSLCGALPVPERLAWPLEKKHDECVAELERLSQPAPVPVALPWTESEQRLMDGNR